MEDRRTSTSAWLIRASGVEAGRRHAVDGARLLIGRAKHADLVVGGEGAEVVSAEHAVIEREEDGGYRISDQSSTNGLLLNGAPTATARLAEGALIELGRGGPRFRFTLQPAGAESVFLHAAEATARIGGTAARLASDAVKAVRRPRLRRRLLAAVAIIVTLAALFGYWRTQRAAERHRALTLEIFNTEALIEAGSPELDELIAEADAMRRELAELEDSLWLRLAGVTRERSFVERELERLLEELGAERYSVPGELVRDVESYIERFQTEDRKVMERAFSAASDRFDAMREQFEEENLPPDLAYLVLVESSLLGGRRSSAGAAGLWQLRPPTARAYGLRVDGEVDERLNPIKATEAAAKYLKRLILEFGSGSSVMLALAAYNLGPTRVRAAVRQVEDPIQQRNFWYLYRARLLPRETREYVPRILAAIIIGRNPERYGFG